MQPLTPPDCNLQEWPRMMIHIARLRGSTFDAISDAEAWRAGVNLWLTAWHNVPAASLEDADAVLIKAAELGRDIKTWRRVKAEAMRGWVLCEDGRWYHPVVAETALEVWISKLLKRLSSGHGNARKYSFSFDPAAITRDIRTACEMLERLDPKSEVLRRPAVIRARNGVPVGADFVPLGEENVPMGPQRDRNRKEKKIPPNPPRGASLEKIEWKGPDAIRLLIRSLGLEGYIAYFTYRDLPERALVTASKTAFDKANAKSADFRKEGVKLLLEKVKAA